MFKLMSLDHFDITGRGTAYIVESPVSAARTGAAMSQAIGSHVEIDGTVYKVAGFEMHMPASPVVVGERIGILVQHNT